LDRPILSELRYGRISGINCLYFYLGLVMKIMIKHDETHETLILKSVDDVLSLINADRSEEFTPYNKKDWIDGLKFTSYSLIRITELI